MEFLLYSIKCGYICDRVISRQKFFYVGAVSLVSAFNGDNAIAECVFAERNAN